MQLAHFSLGHLKTTILYNYNYCVIIHSVLSDLIKHTTISTTAACAIVGVVCSIVFYIGGVVSVLLIHYAITRSKQGAVTTSGRSDAPNTNPMYEDIDVMLPQPDQAGIELQENVAYN